MLIVKKRTTNSARPKGARNAVMHAEKQRRHVEALERNAKWDKLSPKQQLEQLDKRFGLGLGAKKQRDRLAEKIFN